MGRLPKQVARYLDGDQAKLYELIWLRTIASQMESAQLERTTADIAATVGPRTLELRASGQVVKFDGFLTLYQEGRDDEEDEESGRLPPMSAGDPLRRERIATTQHFTEPPPRYSEASLVKRMEELGIGRPSTYASILQVLKDREYVTLDKKRLHAHDKGRIVVAFLEAFFKRYVEYDFTAALEEQLDRISNHEIDWKQVLRDFWRDFSAAVSDTKDLRTTQVLDALKRLSRPAHLPAQGRRLEPARLPLLRRRAAVAEARQVRLLHRLLELPGVPLHPPAFRRGRGRGGRRGRRPARHAGARQGPGDRARRLASRRALRPVHPARRGRGRDEAQALLAAQGARALGGRSRDRAEAALAAPRGGAPSRERRADQGRHRALRPLRPARQDLRLAGPRRRRARDRRQPRHRPHRRQGERRGRAARRGATPGARSARTRRPGSRSSSRPASTGPTSPTARPTPPCPRAWRRRP